MAYRSQISLIRRTLETGTIPRRPNTFGKPFDEVCEAFYQAEDGPFTTRVPQEAKRYRAEENIWIYYFGEKAPFPGVNPDRNSQRPLPNYSTRVPSSYFHGVSPSPGDLEIPRPRRASHQESEPQGRDPTINPSRLHSAELAHRPSQRLRNAPIQLVSKPESEMLEILSRNASNGTSEPNRDRVISSVPQISRIVTTPQQGQQLLQQATPQTRRRKLERYWATQSNRHGYQPQLGWDQKGLPFMAIRCLGSNASSHLNRSLAENMFTDFIIQFDTLPGYTPHYTLVWLEFKNHPTTRDDPLWEELGLLRTFLKQWANSEAIATLDEAWKEFHNRPAREKRAEWIPFQDRKIKKPPENPQSSILSSQDEPEGTEFKERRYKPGTWQLIEDEPDETLANHESKKHQSRASSREAQKDISGAPQQRTRPSTPFLGTEISSQNSTISIQERNQENTNIVNKVPINPNRVSGRNISATGSSFNQATNCAINTHRDCATPLPSSSQEHKGLKTTSSNSNRGNSGRSNIRSNGPISSARRYDRGDGKLFSNVELQDDKQEMKEAESAGERLPTQLGPAYDRRW